jgi:hypothetical protein
MNRSSVLAWGLATLLTCFTYLSAPAAEYCLRPDKEDGTQANSIVCCSTPTGWQGWKDDPHYWDNITGFNKQLLESAHRMSVSFGQSKCENGPDCASLTLDTWGRDPRGQPDIDAGVRNFLRQLRQHQDVSHDPDPSVTRFGSLDGGDLGSLTIWQIRCSFWNDYFLTMVAQRDVLVTIYLAAPDIKDIAPELDSLKELVQSLRITAANSSSPDVIKINVPRLSDEAIRQQLLQFTPLGTPREQVHQFLQSRLYKDSLESDKPGGVHETNTDLYTQLGSYANPPALPEAAIPQESPTTDEGVHSQPSIPEPLPSTTVVRAFWKFDKEGKVRDLEIKREVIEFKPKR